MPVSTPVTSAKLRHHFQYSAWKYVLLILASVFCVDLIYTMTAYRPPENKRIDLYIQSAVVSQEELDRAFEQMRVKDFPEMELIHSSVLMLGGAQDMYAIQQLTTYMAAGEGDLYLLKGEDFKRYASQGVFVDLSEAINQGKLNVGALDVSSGYVAIQEYDEVNDTMVAVSQRRLYGIPLSSLSHLAKRLGIDPTDLYISMTTFNGNDENVLAFMDYLIQGDFDIEISEGMKS